MKELLYKKIADNIKIDIKNGKHPSGTRLPGVRELSAEWKTSSNTVLKALSLLENEGFVRKTQGRGIFVEPDECWNGSIQPEIELLVYDMSSPFNMMLIRNIEKSAGDYGYRLTIKSLDGTLSENKNIAGRIIIPQSSARSFNEADDSTAPVIFIGEFNPIQDFDRSYCVADTYAGFYQAARHLLESGRERIAYIGGTDDLENEVGWNACRDLLSGTGNGFRREYAVSAGGLDAGLGQSAMENLLLGGEFPDGLICCNDSLAAGAYKACRAAGLRVPDDIAVIGAGDQDIASLLEPALTSLKFPSAVMGLTAVNFIDSIVSGRIAKEEVMRSRLDMELVLRRSADTRGVDESVENPVNEGLWL